MKPKTPAAMQQLIQQIREALPFEAPESYLCDGVCKGCSLKLLDYLDSELIDWEDKLQQGKIPELADIQRLAKTSRKIHRVLDRSGLL
jgi:hypothetical protein